MTTRTRTDRSPEAAATGGDRTTPDPTPRNEVLLVGRLSQDPTEVTLPSGDVLVTFRVVVDRPVGYASRQRVDAIECVARAGRVQRSARGWRSGDVVSVSGAVRRRFFRSGAGAASRVEVEVSAARRVRRGPSA